MSVPVSQMWAVSTYVLKQVLRRRRRYPLVLMLEPLLRCNLSCAGCGKIQYPGQVLKKEMAVEDALRAAEECGAPIVSIPGGEPLMHSQIGEMIRGLVAQKRYVYVCTNALLLKERLEQGIFTPSKYLTFSVHLDGDREAHDLSVCREGTYTEAEAAVRLAVSLGYRVTTNTTLFDHVDVDRMRSFFDRMMELGVEGLTISPGYSYQKAPDQEHFLSRSRTFNLFQDLLHKAKRSWRFNQSPLFLEYLLGKRHFECTPWGNPCYTLFGWQRPCYLLQEGYAGSFGELLSETDWESYGRASGNPKCQQCMVHSGHEPTAVHATFASFSGFWSTVRATFRGVDASRGKTITPPAVTRTCTTGLEATEPGTLDRALSEAVDFRGNVTLTLTDDSTRDGYLFDTSAGRVSYFPKGGGAALRLERAQVKAVERTGRDHADGKSWEAWVERYRQKKADEAKKTSEAAAQTAPTPVASA